MTDAAPDDRSGEEYSPDDDRNYANDPREQAKLQAEHRRELNLDPEFDGVDITQSEGPILEEGPDVDTGSGEHRHRD